MDGIKKPGQDRSCYLAALDPDDPRAAGARVAVLGVPHDEGVSHRAGASGAPSAIRAASQGIESYCPLLERDLEDADVVDLGDVVLAQDQSSPQAAIERLRHLLCQAPHLPTLMLGGDHLTALPFIERTLARHPDLEIVQIDAHLDLRDTWEEGAYSHATVMRRVLEVMGERARLWQWGIRSGLREEFALARAHPRVVQVGNTHAAGLELADRLAAGRRPVYITLDADGIDPAEIPGTGNPEPAGLRFFDVEAAIVSLARQGAKLVGADVVEIAPALDPSGVSAVAGARLARTLLLALCAGQSA